MARLVHRVHSDGVAHRKPGFVNGGSAIVCVVPNRLSQRHSAASSLFQVGVVEHAGFDQQGCGTGEHAFVVASSQVMVGRHAFDSVPVLVSVVGAQKANRGHIQPKRQRFPWLMERRLVGFNIDGAVPVDPSHVVDSVHGRDLTSWWLAHLAGLLAGAGDHQGCPTCRFFGKND